MRNDKKTLKFMLGGFTLICLCSMVMHKLVMKKENLYIQRSEPRYNLEKVDPETLLLEGGGEIEGEVIAVSFDKFFLRQKGKVQPFMLGQDNIMPTVGQVYKVSYVSGRPPTCVTISQADSPNSDSQKARESDT